MQVSVLPAEHFPGVDSQPAFVDLVGAVFALQIPANFFHEIGGERTQIMFELKAQGCIACARRLKSGQLAVFEHRVDDQIPAM